jgi:hypothetical protein
VAKLPKKMLRQQRFSTGKFCAIAYKKDGDRIALDLTQS